MEMTLADHAEAWWRESNNIMPNRGTPEWNNMYKQWIDFAFANMTTETKQISSEN